MEHPDIYRITHNGREIILIGTAHVSAESVRLVEETLEAERPDTVCIELCASRYEAMKKKDQWLNMDIVRVIRENRAHLLLSQLLMASFQRRLADKFKINPGEEMRCAAQKAEEIGAAIVLADREIRITLIRSWRKLRLWSKIKFGPQLLMSLLSTEDISEEDVENLKKQDALETALQTFGEALPEVKKTLIDERDLYLAKKIVSAPGQKIVGVVGAGHVAGILRNVHTEIDLAALEEIPPKGPWGPIVSWGLCVAMLALFVAGFFVAGSQGGLNMIKWWSVITAGAAALGAVAMMAHPLTILSAALSAPIATLHPLVATGWVAGLVEASLRKPQVKDFLDLANDIGSVRGFWRNKITRILLIVAVVNLTASVGTFVAIPVVVRLLH